MGYCAQCKTSYRPAIKVCADCGGPLVDSPPISEENNESFIEVLTTDMNEDVILARQVLGDASIETLVHDLSDHVFPTHIGRQSERRVAVPTSRRAEAVQLLQEAIDDGALSERAALA